MDKELRRLGALIAAVLLVAAACSSSTTPSASVAAPGGSASAEPSGSEGTASGEPTPGITAIPGTGSAAKPGDVEIRWYCCLGTGDAPEQV